MLKWLSEREYSGISVRTYSRLIGNVYSQRELKETSCAMRLSLWLISLEFGDWYAETFVQQLEVQFLLCFIDLKNQLDPLLQLSVPITLPISIPGGWDSCSVWLEFIVAFQWSVVFAAWVIIKIKLKQIYWFLQFLLIDMLLAVIHPYFCVVRMIRKMLQLFYNMRGYWYWWQTRKVNILA